MRQQQAIDILKLMAESTEEKWNEWLDNCYRTENLPSLKQVYYGLQAGMDDLAKQKLNSEKISVFFLRLQRSIENTVRAVFRKKYPMPGDKYSKEGNAKFLEAKRKRDQEMNLFFEKSRY